MHYLVMKEMGHATETTKLSQNNHSVFARARAHACMHVHACMHARARIYIYI